MTGPALEAVPGLRWSPRGYATLTGPLLAMASQIQRRIDVIASRFGAQPLSFPPFLSVAELQRIDYFGSFPQLASFAVHLDGGDDSIARFAADPVAADGSAALGSIAPVREVLTPAACYHLYVHLQGNDFGEAQHFTTSATCHRREDYYAPLERQWAFTMREIMVVGTAGEVRGFLDAAQGEMDRMAVDADLPLGWKRATDPFFQPSKNPKYLMQRIDPTKHELVYGESLAIGSLNLHHDHFGRAFSLSRDGQPATTGCAAFGIERWLAAIVREHGADAGNWPDLGGDG